MVAGLIVVASLIGLVVFHEAGHFLAARAVGIRATRFFVFFPPKLVSVQKGETEYGIGTIPAGGFVKLPGMFRPGGSDVHWRLQPVFERAMGELDDAERREQLKQTFAQLEAMNDPDALGRAATRIAADIREAAAGQDSPAREQRVLAALARKFDAVADDCHPRAYWRAALWRRMVVIAAGPAVNVLLAFAILFVAVTWFIPRVSAEYRIGAVIAHSPAAAAGVHAGESIVSWNGRPTTDAGFPDRVVSGRGKPINLVVRDGNTTRSYRLVPRALHGMGSTPLVGVEPEPIQSTVHRAGWSSQSVGGGLSETWYDMHSTVTASISGLAKIFHTQDRKQLTTTVGFVEDAPSVARVGQLPEMIALISLGLAIMNLLPLLPLDGGHLAFGVVEWLRRGRALPREAFERASFVGLALIACLFLIGLQNDLGIRS